MGCRVQDILKPHASTCFVPELHRPLCFGFIRDIFILIVYITFIWILRNYKSWESQGLHETTVSSCLFSSVIYIHLFKISLSPFHLFHDTSYLTFLSSSSLSSSNNCFDELLRSSHPPLDCVDLMLDRSKQDTKIHVSRTRQIHHY